jgi:hypothetical protein
MHEQQLRLKFKGERDYLHGTDIYNETLTWLANWNPKIEDIDFAFHRLAKHQLKAMLGMMPQGIEPAGVCSFTSGGSRKRVFLVETERPITERYPYQENDIVDSMEMDPSSSKGTLHGKTAYSDIEVWVAMAKALHYKAFPQLKGKWLFVRGRFPSYARHTSVNKRTLVIAASFNEKLTRSEALIDNVKVGEIFFSMT